MVERDKAIATLEQVIATLRARDCATECADVPLMIRICEWTLTELKETGDPPDSGRVEALASLLQRLRSPRDL